MEINIVFGINTNSYSADERECTDVDALSDFTKNIIFGFRNSQQATWQFKFPGKKNRYGKHLSGIGEDEKTIRKKMES